MSNAPVLADNSSGLQSNSSSQTPGVNDSDASDDSSSEAQRLQVCIAPERVNSVEVSDTDWVEAGLVASGNTLRFALAPEAELLRTLYNRGAAEIAAKRTELAKVAAGEMTEKQVAELLAKMRTEHALHVRQVGTWLSRRAAELFDSVRGNTGRPTYLSLDQKGKTDAQIIASAAKTNRFINRLPRTLKWTGRAFWFISAGISVAIIVSAKPEDRQVVAQQEIDGALGGALGGLVVTGLFLAVGAATAGAGYVILLFVGSAAGATLAQNMSLTKLLDIAPHENPDLAGKLYYVDGNWTELDFFVFRSQRRPFLGQRAFLSLRQAKSAERWSAVVGTIACSRWSGSRLPRLCSRRTVGIPRCALGPSVSAQRDCRSGPPKANRCMM